MRTFHKNKPNLLIKLLNYQGLLFHLAGIVAIIWFLFRVLPRPDRIRYPCQQMSVSIALGYIAFWSLLWSAIFHGIGLWIKKVKYKTSAFAPVILVAFVLIFSITSNVYGVNKTDDEYKIIRWDPIPKEPIGTPYGYNPGRVVWTWNQNATEKELISYWWKNENNNQTIIDQMFSLGIQSLAEVGDDYSAWDLLFKYFNQQHGHGNVGYQDGEKIAIKINLNNCGSYTLEDNDLDANPYVIKAILRQLVNTVNVAQEDITIYDASRQMADWFYNRVYYEEYPADPLVAEFADVHYVDSNGGASGRNQVVASTERIYFAAGSCQYRTLPNCVFQADYLINVPILKRHPINTGVTLAGKNFFGTWMEPVSDVHNYHQLSFTQGNPAPQTDLFAHKHIGGKVVLYIGDGIFATPNDHRVIGRFEMNPFENDWTNSLFFSQDPVALDSVMYSFLHAEGTNPCEGSQNYLHQSADPPQDVYDPENDGKYVSDSLGVHEHWDTNENIFSSERFSGPSNDGIDYVFAEEGELMVDAGGPYYGFINESLQFNGYASGGLLPYIWEWDFGDGGTSDEQNSVYTYTSIGNYTVSLTVTDEIQNTFVDYTWSLIQGLNSPPDQPNIDGPKSGKPDISYNYTFLATDPDEDEIWYHIGWGDKEIIYIYGPYPSGEEFTLTYNWSEKGMFTISAKARDTFDAESNWSEFEVEIPRYRPTTYLWYHLFFERFPLLEKLLSIIRVI